MSKIKIHNISKSKCGSFIDCPDYYNRKYLKKEKPSNTIDASGLIRGIVVHRAAEMIAKRELPNSLQREDIERLPQIFQDYYVNMGNCYLHNSAKVPGEDDLDTMIESIVMEGILVMPLFLEVVSSSIRTGQLFVDNQLEMASVIARLEEDRDAAITWEEFERVEYLYKDKLLEQLPHLKKFIIIYYNEYKAIEAENEIVEVTQNTTMKIDDENELHFTSILDRVYLMKAADIAEEGYYTPDVEDVHKELLKKRKPELVGLCLEHKLPLTEKNGKIKETIAVIAEKLTPVMFKQAKREAEKQHEKDRVKRIELLKGLGYEEGDPVPVVQEIKTGTRRASIGELLGKLDVYVYCLLFFLKYQKIPVFQFVRLIVTSAGNTDIQKVNIFITKQKLEDAEVNFRDLARRMFIDQQFPKNFMNNWKCTGKSCQYYDACQADQMIAYALNTRKVG